MDDFTVAIYDQLDRLVTIPPAVKLIVENYDTDAELHHKEATISVDISETAAMSQVGGWLAHHVHIYDEMGTIQWWGLVTDVEFRSGGLEMEMSLESLANRVKVIYTVETPDGTVDAETDWDQDDDSVERYGIREKIVTAADVSEDMALALQAQELARYAWPRRTVRPRIPGGDVGGTIRCRGYLWLLDWLYHHNLAGMEENPAGSKALPLAWYLQSDLIGFEKRKKRLHDAGTRLAGLTPGTKIVVSGSPSNNGNHVITEGIQFTDELVVELDNIEFDPSDDILDSAYFRLDEFTVGEMIEIEDTTSNNGYYWVKTNDADHMTVRFGTIVAETGADPTITQFHSVVVEGAFAATELPSPTVTIEATGKKIAQSFEFLETENWTIAEVWLKIRKSGTPTAEIDVGIYSDSSGSPGTLIEEVDEVTTTLSTDEELWLRFEFSNTDTYNDGTTYWIVVEMDATQSHNCYVLNCTEKTYARGSLKLWNGTTSAWEAQADGWTMAFHIRGRLSSIDQMEAIVDASSHLTGFSSPLTTTVDAYQYQPNPEMSALDRFKDMLRSGDANGERWIVRTTPDRLVVVDQAPDPEDAILTLGGDGVLRHAAGVPAAEGTMIAGQWVKLDDVPFFGDVAGWEAVFVEHSAYQNGSGLQVDLADEDYRLASKTGRTVREVMPLVLRKLGGSVL